MKAYRLFFALILFCGIVSAGCRRRAATTAPEHTGDTPVIRVAVLLAPSGRGDKSYNDMALAGIEEARKKTRIEVIELLPARVNDYPNTIERIAKQNTDLIVAVGFLYTDSIAAVAKNFPAARFVLIDGQVESSPNVRSVTFRPQEGSFLVGVAAGLATKSGTVGFIGGMDIPIIHTFACGFREGVQHAATLQQRKLSVVERYVGGTPDAFSNPAKGRDMARLMFQSDVDIIYHAAGASGNGIIQAAKDTGKYVIGVDTDQSYLAPDHVLTSMRKRIDLAVEGAINDVRKGSFAGGARTMELTNGGVDYVRTHLGSDELWARVEQAKRDVLDGKIKVCPGAK